MWMFDACVAFATFVFYHSNYVRKTRIHRHVERMENATIRVTDRHRKEQRHEQRQIKTCCVTKNANNSQLTPDKSSHRLSFNYRPFGRDFANHRGGHLLLLTERTMPTQGLATKTPLLVLLWARGTVHYFPVRSNRRLVRFNHGRVAALNSPSLTLATVQ